MAQETLRTGRSIPRDSCWIVNYDAEHALHNLRVFSTLSGETARIYLSRDCAAIVISSLPLEYIREPHVMAWRDSFYEVAREEFIRRAAAVMNGKREHMGGEAPTKVAFAC